MKKLYSILTILACCLFFPACEGINDKHDIYMQGGEKLHVGKMDSLYLYPGNLRAQLKCWINDKRSVWIVAQKNGGDEEWISIPEMDRNEAIEVYINDLFEGSNQIRLYTANKDKTVTSVPTQQSVTVYGEEYIAGLTQRTVESAQSCEGFLSITWGPKTSEQLVGQKIYYTDKDGNKKTYIASVNTKVSVIKNVADNGTFEYASLYMPVATAIDTFEVAKKDVVEYESTNISEELEKLGMRPATEIAKDMTLGWNLGNSFEVASGETAWTPVLTTPELIKGVKDAGFNALRIPCIWALYKTTGGAPDYTIEPARMARVKEVVNYGYDIGMYVILNTHHDWLDKLFKEAITPEKEEEAFNKVTKIWGQIASEFKDYDDKLLFAFLNEAPINRTTMPIYLRLAQEFVDVVRNSGGKNLGRTLVIQCPNTNMVSGYDFMEFPVDKVPNRTMTEIHFYSPFNFCMSGAGTYFWGEPYIQYGDYDKSNQEDYVDRMFKMMKDRFADSGIPVVMGEYGVNYGTKTEDGGTWGPKPPLEDPELQQKYYESRAYWLKYVTKTAKDNGMIPFLWDDTWNFPLMDRKTYKVYDYDGLDIALEALNEGAKEGVYPY